MSATTMTVARMVGLADTRVIVSPFSIGEVGVAFVDRTGTASVELLGDAHEAHRLLSDALAAVDAIAAQADVDAATCPVCGDVLNADQMADHTTRMHQ